MRKRVQIVLYTDELVKDINNVGYMSGETIKDPTMIRLKNLLQDISEEGYRERTVQSIKLAVGEIKDKLFDYIEDVFTMKRTRPDGTQEDKVVYNGQMHEKIGVGASIAISDKYSEPTQFVVTMMLSDNCAVTNMDFVKNLMHEFIVNRTVAQYAMPIDANFAQTWKALADNNLEQLDNAMNRRRMVKRSMSVF